MIDNIDETDQEWIDLLKSYPNNIGYDVNAGENDFGNKARLEDSPEGIFIVGERMPE